jgi:undecaprenyl-diphosphatase
MARFDRLLRLLARRVGPRAAFALSLTASLAALVIVGSALGALVEDVAAGDGATRLDRLVLHWFVAHRQSWLTTAMQVVTTLGSSVFMVPLVLAVGLWFWRRGGARRPFGLLAAAYGGSYLLSQSVKLLIGRPRPPVTVGLGHWSGYAFPSGHATQAAAVYGMLAVVLAAATPRSRQKMAARAGAAVTVIAVGISRLYLAPHWLTDVLGGWGLGSLWFLAVLAASQAISSLRLERDPAVDLKLP